MTISPYPDAATDWRTTWRRSPRRTWRPKNSQKMHNATMDMRGAYRWRCCRYWDQLHGASLKSGPHWKRHRLQRVQQTRHWQRIPAVDGIAGVAAGDCHPADILDHGLAAGDLDEHAEADSSGEPGQNCGGEQAARRYLGDRQSRNSKKCGSRHRRRAPSSSRTSAAVELDRWRCCGRACTPGSAH